MDFIKNSDKNIGIILNSISKFYNNDTFKDALQIIIKEVSDYCNIDISKFIVRNNELDTYLKFLECKTNKDLTCYEIINYYDELQSQVQHATNLFNSCSNETTNKFLKYCNDDNYLYLTNTINQDNINILDKLEIKEILNSIGFTSQKINDIKELYIFPIMLDGFFSYLSFEKYSDDKFTDLELLALTTVCRTINSKIEKDELVKKYREDVLMKDVILQNEQIPMAVVEKDTFKILYFNDLYYNVLPNIELGRPCYELFGQKQKCTDCCIDGEQILNNINSDDHQWIKKATAFKMSNGKDAYMIYTKDSIDYVKQLNDLDELTKSLLFLSFQKYYENFIQKSAFNYALCTLDIDKFKYINSIFGYKTGDDVLKNIANVIRDFVDAEENFCRIAEDKFSIFLRYKDDEHLLLKLKTLFEQFQIMKNNNFSDIKITVAGGVTIVDKSKSLNILLDESTVARKNAKGSISNKFKFYDPNLDNTIKKEIEIEERIPHAIENKEFVAFLQPKFDLHTEKICGSEALVRWITPDGMIYPDEFIPFFEKNGFIGTLDFIVYEQVMQHIRSCLDRGLPVYTVSLNVSRIHIKDKHFMEKFLNLIELYNIPTKYLELELTESVFVKDSTKLKNFISKIKKQGIKISIDDFGTAYSSLQMLTDIDADILKIDKGFLDNIQDVDTSTINKDKILLKNIINLARELEFIVICEGVETREQVELLKKIGCQLGQGYVFAKPMSIQNYEEQFLLNKS